MGRGTPTGQGSVFQQDSGYGSQQPMASNMRYTGPQQGNPNALTFARGPIPLDQQGPAVGGSIGALAGGLGQIPLQQQQMGQVGQNLFNMLRGQPATQQPALTPAVMPQQPASPQLQAAFQAASNQMAGRPDNYVPQGTPAPANRPDADFNINTAMNTFNQRLGDYVKSGRMSVADAQRAQAEMRALQLNPTTATRQQATEIAQRNLQVGPFSPANVAARQTAEPRVGISAPPPPDRSVPTPPAPTPAATPTPPPSLPRLPTSVAPPPPPLPAGTVPRTPAPTSTPTPAVTSPPTPTPTLPLVARTPAPTPGMPEGWNASSAYRDFGGKLAQMIKSGQLTPQQANAIKDPAFQATKLGNTPEAFAAMQKALAGLAGYAAGGYATQVAPEDPRMQAMRYLQRLGR